MDFVVPADHRIKLKESEKKDKYLDLAGGLKNYETWRWLYYYTSHDWCFWDRHQMIIKGTGGDHPNYSIIENGPGDLRRLVVI